MELPTPRFKDNGNGTIKDNLTGLIWLKNANCANTTTTWQGALNFVAGINDGTHNCGDTSGKNGSHRTDWRLPNRNELTSQLDLGTFSPALPSNHPFSNFQASFYWSSTTFAFDSNFAWFVDFNAGVVSFDGKVDFNGFVLAVRGGS